MLEMVIRILALTKKELLAILKDPRGRASLFIPPVIQCFIFGYAATYDLNDIPYVVLDQDRSSASHDLIARLEGSGSFRRVATLDSAQDLKLFINSKQALLAVQISQDFERQLQSGHPVEVQVIADGRNSNSAATAMGYVGSVVEQFNADWQSAHNMTGPPLKITTRAWYNPNLETRWNIIPGLIGTLTFMQTLLMTAMSVAREREQGTFDQLLVTPFRPLEIMAGKSLPSILIGSIQATSILLVAQLWFHIPFSGSFITLYSGLILFVVAAVGMGLLLSSLVSTMQQAMLYAFMFMLPFSLLSGLMTPVGNMPVLLQYLTLLNPLRYAIDIVHRVYLEGAVLSQLTGDLWPLAVISAVTLTMASWMFRNKLA